MEVNFKRVVEIKDVGLFKCVGEWDAFSKWEDIKRPAFTFVSVDVNKNNLFTGIFNSFNNEKGNKLNIIMVQGEEIIKKFKELEGANNTTRQQKKY